MFQSDHVDPGGVLPVAALQDDVGMETRKKIFVQLVERQVAAPVGTKDVAFQVAADTPIFIVGRLAAAHSHHAAELLVVAPEEIEQTPRTLCNAEIGLLDHRRRDERTVEKEFAVARFETIADVVHVPVEFPGSATPAGGLTARCVP